MTSVNRSSGSIVVTADQESNKASFYIPPGGQEGQALLRTGAADRVVGWTTLTAAMVGLPLVDNVPDNLKPISQAAQLALDGKLTNNSPRIFGSFRLTPNGTDSGYGAFWDVDGNQLRLRFTNANNAGGGMATQAWTINAETGKTTFNHAVEILGELTLPDGSAVGNVKLDATNVFTKKQQIRTTSRASTGFDDADLSIRASSASGPGAYATVHFGPPGTDNASHKNVQWGLRHDDPLFGAFSATGALLWGFRPNGSETYLPGNVKLGIPTGSSVTSGIPALNVGVTSGAQDASVSIVGGDSFDSPTIGVLGAATNLNLRLRAKGSGKVVLGDINDEVVGKDAEQVLTGKSFNWSYNTFTLTAAQFYSALTGRSGDGGSVVFSNNPALVGATGDSPASNDSSARLAPTSWVRSQNYLTGNQDITFSGDVTGSGSTSVALTLADSGVTPGTYTRVVIDSKGRATWGGTLQATDIPSIPSTKISDFNASVNGRALTSFLLLPTSALNLGNQRIQNLADPLNPTDAVNKRFVESLIQGLDPKGLVNAASTGNLTLSGLQTVDGVALAAGDRCLAKDQTNAAENGIYIVSAGAWTRAVDADTWYELSMGYTIVAEGTANKGIGYYFRVGETGTLGTDPLVVDQFSFATEVTVGAGLVKNGNEISVGQGEGISTANNQVSLVGHALELNQLSTVGLVVRTQFGQLQTRVLESTQGITLVNFNGSSGNPSIQLRASLSSIGGLTPAADRFAYYTSASAAALTTLTATGRSVLGVTNLAALQELIATVPTGGTVNQVLTKASTSNYDSVWTTFTTQLVSEHSSALYFTDARAKAAVVDDTIEGEDVDRAPSSRVFKLITNILGADLNDSTTGVKATKLDRVYGRAVLGLAIQQNLNPVGYAGSWSWQAGQFALGFSTEDNATQEDLAITPMTVDPATGKITFHMDVDFLGTVTGAGSGGGGSIDPSVTNHFTAQQFIGVDRLLATPNAREARNAQLLLGSVDATDSDNLVTIGFGSRLTAMQNYQVQFGADYSLGHVGWYNSTGTGKSISSLDLTSHYQSGTSYLGGDADKSATAGNPALIVKPLGVRNGNESWVVVQGGDASLPASVYAESINGSANLWLKAKGSGEVLIDPSGYAVVGTSKTQTLTSKTINWGDNTILLTAAQLAASVLAKTGSGNLVFATSPALTGATGDAPPSNSNDGRLVTSSWVVSKNYLTTNETITFTGDVTGSGSTSVALTLPNIVSPGWASRVQYNAKGQVIGAAQLAAEDIPTIDSTKISDFNTAVRANRLDQLAAPTANVSVGNQRITNLADPLADTDATNRRYVQGLLEGLDSKPMVRAATTATLTVYGSSATTLVVDADLVIDGVTLVDGDRVLVKDMTSKALNGIYVYATNGAWARTADANTWYELSKAYMLIAEGTVNKGRGYYFNVGETGTLGSGDLIVEQWNSPTVNTFGGGLSVVDNHVTVKVGTGITIDGNGGVALLGQAAQLNSMGTTGFFVKAAGIILARSMATSGAGIGVTNQDGLLGNPTFALTTPLAALGDLTPAADRLPYYTSGTASALATFTAYGRSIAALADQTALRTLVGNVPTGGTLNQVLMKTSGSDYASAWTSLTTSHVSEGTNKYYVAATARADLLVTSVAGTASDKAPTQLAVKDALDGVNERLDNAETNINNGVKNYGIALVNGADLNAQTTSGFYYTGTSASNGPAGADVVNINMLVMGPPANIGAYTQMFFDRVNSKGYMRSGTRANALDPVTWGAWKELGGGGGGGSTVPSKTVTDTTYVVVLTDAGYEIIVDRATTGYITINLDSVTNFPVDTVIQITQAGIGAAVVQKGNASVVFLGKGGLKTDGQHSSIFLKKRAATNTWFVTGGVE